MTTNKKDTSPEVPMEIITQEKQVIKSDADIDGFIELRQKFIAPDNIATSRYHELRGIKQLTQEEKV